MVKVPVKPVPVTVKVAEPAVAAVILCSSILGVKFELSMLGLKLTDLERLKEIFPKAPIKERKKSQKEARLITCSAYARMVEQY